MSLPSIPSTSAMDELLMLHSEYLALLDMPPTTTTAMLEQAAAPITLDEIDAACHRLAAYARPGPNGRPIELFVASKPARFLLCQLANQLLAKPELVTKGFVANSIIHSSTSGDPASGQRLSQYNMEWQIFADVFAQRLGHAISSLISPEQSAVLPGRHVRDTLYTLMAAQSYLQTTGKRGLFLFLDKARVDDRFSFQIISRLLRNFGLPPTFIAAIDALYQSAPSGVLASNDTSKDFGKLDFELRGDYLSSIFFVMVMELLRCSLHSKGLLHTAHIDLPVGKVSYVCHGSSVVITASSSDRLPAIRAALDLFSDATGIGFDLSKTKALFVGYDFSAVPHVPRPEFPLKPIADREELSYLGAYFGTGNNAITSGKGSTGDGLDYDILAGRYIGELLTRADAIAQGYSDHHSRMSALDAFLAPRLKHLLAFVPVTPYTTPQMTGHLKGLVRRYSYWLPNADDDAKLEECTGIYGFVDYDNTYYAVQLEQVRIAATYFYRLARLGNDPTVPTWAKLMLHCWRENIRGTSNINFPKMLKNLDAADFDKLFFDPFLQFHPDMYCRPSQSTWPLVWWKRFRALFSSIAHRGIEVEIEWPVENVPALRMPFVGSGLWKPSKNSWRIIQEAFEGVALPLSLITVADLHLFISRLERLNRGNGKKPKYSKDYHTMLACFKDLYRRATAHDESLSPDLRNSSVASHLVFRRIDHSGVHIPFSDWCDISVTRAKMQLLPKIVDAPKAPKASKKRKTG